MQNVFSNDGPDMSLVASRGIKYNDELINYS